MREPKSARAPGTGPPGSGEWKAGPLPRRDSSLPKVFRGRRNGLSNAEWRIRLLRNLLVQSDAIEPLPKFCRSNRLDGPRLTNVVAGHMVS